MYTCTHIHYPVCIRAICIYVPWFVEHKSLKLYTEHILFSTCRSPELLVCVMSLDASNSSGERVTTYIDINILYNASLKPQALSANPLRGSARPKGRVNAQKCMLLFGINKTTVVRRVWRIHAPVLISEEWIPVANGRGVLPCLHNISAITKTCHFEDLCMKTSSVGYLHTHARI